MNSPLRFDPRTVPEQAQTRRWPALPHERLQARAIADRFAAQIHWQPEANFERPFTPEPSQLRPAAVLLALVQGSEGLEVVLTERTAHLSSHAGQIALPGGKIDAQDGSAVDAALREAHEEIGLPPQHVRVLGELPVYETSTAFAITPVVALLDGPWTLQMSPGEVADCFTVPLSFLMNPANHRLHGTTWQGHWRQWYAMPYAAPLDAAKERYIWGATAAIFRNFYHFLRVS
jgi:8-oxo-dGTP pyrophosphatase MutT (NUDIX family)